MPGGDGGKGTTSTGWSMGIIHAHKTISKFRKKQAFLEPLIKEQVWEVKTRFTGSSQLVQITGFDSTRFYVKLLAANIEDCLQLTTGKLPEDHDVQLTKSFDYDSFINVIQGYAVPDLRFIAVTPRRYPLFMSCDYLSPAFRKMLAECNVPEPANKEA